jgi:hypothetical protein
MSQATAYARLLSDSIQGYAAGAVAEALNADNDNIASKVNIFCFVDM